MMYCYLLFIGQTAHCNYIGLWRRLLSRSLWNSNFFSCLLASLTGRGQKVSPVSDRMQSLPCTWYSGQHCMWSEISKPDELLTTTGNIWIIFWVSLVLAIVHTAVNNEYRTHLQFLRSSFKLLGNCCKTGKVGKHAKRLTIFWNRA